jgi:hypothetical protein
MNDARRDLMSDPLIRAAVEGAPPLDEETLEALADLFQPVVQRLADERRAAQRPARRAA